MIGSRKGRTALHFPSNPSQAEDRAFTSSHSLSKYITKFFRVQHYLYRSRCKLDKESSLRGFRQQHHSMSWTSYRLMGVSYRQTSFGDGYGGVWQSLHHRVLDISVFGCVCVCVRMFLWRVRLQRGQSFAAKCFIFWESLFFKLHELHLKRCSTRNPWERGVQTGPVQGLGEDSGWKD